MMGLEDDDGGANLVGKVEELAGGCDIGAEAEIRGLEVHELEEVSVERMSGRLRPTGEGRLERRMRRHDATVCVMRVDEIEE